jgi:hypothetical protein
VIIFSNLRAAEASSYAVPLRTAVAALDALVDAGRDVAAARWERELIAWLGDRRAAITRGTRAALDLGEVAWTPDHFGDQQRFFLTLCERGGAGAPPEVAVALGRLRELAGHHSRDHVAVGRRWRWVQKNPVDPAL